MKLAILTLLWVVNSQAAFIGSVGGDSAPSASPVFSGRVLIPVGTYADSPLWPGSQVAGIGFAGDAAANNTGFNYTDDGVLARGFGMVINGREGLRLRQNLADLNNPYVVAWTVYPDTVNKATSAIGIATNHYANAYIDRVNTGASSGRALHISPAATGNAGIGFDNDTAKEWYLKAYDGTAYTEYGFHSNTASSRRSWAIKPAANATNDTIPGIDLILQPGAKTANNADGGDLVAGVGAGNGTGVSGNFFIPAVAGAPSGTPTTRSGYVAMKYDTSNNKLCVYNSGWKCSAAFAP